MSSGNQMRRILLTLALFALAAALSGCGGVARTIDPVADAATKSREAGSGKVTMAIDAAADGKTYSVTGTGAFAQDAGELTLDMSSLFEELGQPSGGGEVKVVYLREDGEHVVYLHVPALASMIPGGKSWVRLNLDKAGSAMGLDLGKALAATNQNPGEVLDLLRAGGQIEEVGKETLDGAATTHYKGTIDVGKVAELEGVSADLVRRLKAEGAPSELPVEVWVGDDGLVRQVRTVQNLATSGERESATVTIGFSDYGTDVSVTAPPAAEVFDLTALATMAAGGKPTTR